MDLKFRTTAARNAGLGIFYLSVGGKKIKPTRPTTIPCYANGDYVMRFTGIQDVESTGVRYFTSPVNWTANTDFYISGVFMGELIS